MRCSWYSWPFIILCLLPATSSAETESALSLLLRDPSKPPQVSAQPNKESSSEHSASPALPAERWQLGLIRFSERDALAIINGKVVRVGQTVDGLLVESIHRQGVSGVAGTRPVELVMEINRAAANMVVRSSSQPTKMRIP
ncbi:hypothetical protein [Candidatus Magnetaquicoccus inordinatus]|uniref:hypothetical protein n=1 Tax=Candidatus Magnetaquicoccus inordinatus TaxID=2496818 RepID=UPI00102CD909|nr:hypothetical protein [Candidatus Magnetaquicoccus inordinatus]